MAMSMSLTNIHVDLNLIIENEKETEIVYCPILLKQADKRWPDTYKSNLP